MAEQNNMTYWVVGVIVVVLGALGAFFIWSNNNTRAGSGNQTTTSSASSSATVQTAFSSASDLPLRRQIDVELTMKDFRFEPSSFTAKPGDIVQVTLKNAQGIHDFRIDAWNVKSEMVSVGEDFIVDFTVPANATGEVEFYCGVGSHRQQGMTGKIKVEA
jgi:plastocyanin